MRISDWSSDVCSSDLASPADVFDQEIAHVGTDPKCFHRGIEPHTKNQVGEVAKNDEALILAGAMIVGDSGGRTENRIIDRFRSTHWLAISGAPVLQRGPSARRQYPGLDTHPQTGHTRHE